MDKFFIILYKIDYTEGNENQADIRHLLATLNARK